VSDPLRPFDALVGTWETQATHPMFEGVVRGEVSYEWLEGGKYLIERVHMEHELFPDAICVIGAPEHGEGLVGEYFDQRGVRRTYGISFEGGVLRRWRDDPTFAQRFEGTPADEFTGQWQVAEAPDEFNDDLRVIYRRKC
jgi:hypothetical protein